MHIIVISFTVVFTNDREIIEPHQYESVIRWIYCYSTHWKSIVCHGVTVAELFRQ